MKKSLLTVILVASYPILFFYANNQNQLRINIIWQPLLVSIFFCITLWLLSSLILKNSQKGTLITIIITFWFYFYGHLSGLLKNIFIPIGPNIVLGPDKILFPISVALLILIIISIIKQKKSPVEYNNFFLIFLFVLVLIQIVNIFPKLKDINFTNTNNQSIGTQQNTPDIYFIILDGYAREDILKNVFNFDNGDFVIRLQKMGFTVINDARSNYTQTFLSLSSTLNMKHVNYFTKELGTETTDVSVPFQMIDQNEVSNILRQKGYKIINLASGWAPTDKMGIADINFDNSQLFNLLGVDINLNEFNIVFLQTTALSPFIKNTLIDQSRAKVIYALNKLGEIPYIQGSKFTIAHFNIPHPPYLFDENGNQIPNQSLDMAGESFSDRTNYIKQLKFINSQIGKILPIIINNSATPPIIILQSDHGPASILGHPFKWVRPAPADGIAERTSILSALYLPTNIDVKLIPKTPVNDFRFIFNQYFNGSYEMLPETSYFSDYKSIYEFFEVK